MSRRGAPLAAAGMALVVANLAAWGAWALTRPAYSDAACAVVQARRDAQDREPSRVPLLDAYTRSEHLLFSRPLRPLASEPVPVQALYVANALPLAAAWAFVVPSGSTSVGPTCSESATCGVLFLLLASAQWGFVGGTVAYWRHAR